MTQLEFAGHCGSLLSVLGGRRRQKPKVPDVQFHKLNVNLPGPELIFGNFELSATSLIHLPNELLLNIFKDIDNRVLYSLSLLCRRLHYFALPIYLARLGIPDSLGLSTKGEVVLFISEVHDVLRGLRVALFVTSIKRLICKFQSPEMEILTLRSLRRLLGKLTHVEEVTLDFPGSSWPYCRRSILEKWNQIFVDILQDIVVEKSTSALVIRQKGYSASLKGRSRKAAVGMVLKTPANVLGNITHSVASMLSSSPTIHETQISRISPQHSAWLSSTPFLAWSIQALNNSLITRLSIEYTSPTSEEWSHILPCAYMPALVDLSLDSKYIPYAALAKFLARHAQISYLRLSEPYILTSQPYLPITTLPKLKTLDASIQYIIHLLTPEGSFPELASVTASFAPSSLIDSLINFSDMDEALIPVAHRINQLTLSIRLDVTGQGWIREISLNDETEGGFCLLHRVTSLELRAYPSWLYEAPLASRLVLLPMLKRISISVPSRGRIGFWLDLAQFIATLRDTWITTVEYEGKIHRINRHLTS